MVSLSMHLFVCVYVVCECICIYTVKSLDCVCCTVIHVTFMLQTAHRRVFVLVCWMLWVSRVGQKTLMWLPLRYLTHGDGGMRLHTSPRMSGNPLSVCLCVYMCVCVCVCVCVCCPCWCVYVCLSTSCSPSLSLRLFNECFIFTAGVTPLTTRVMRLLLHQLPL